MGRNSGSPEFRAGGYFFVFFVEIPGRAISGLCSRSGRSQAQSFCSPKSFREITLKYASKTSQHRLFSAIFQKPRCAHHPHNNNEEHRQCNPAWWCTFAVLSGSENSYTTPLKKENPTLIIDRKSLAVTVYGWWSPICKHV